jgi:Domain of unknown function (DUF5666)
MNRIAAGAAVCCAVLFVGACGGGTPATGSATAAPTTRSGGGAGDGARGFPGATGLLAEIDGTTLQVQGTDAQTAVTYSAATTFTNTVASRLSDVVVGVCVQARSARPPSGTGGTAPTPAPSANTGPIVAASVEITPAVNGSCSSPVGPRTPFPGRTRGPGATGGPTRSPSAGGNGLGGRAFGGFGAFGKVTAVNGATFTVESSRPQGGGAATTAAPGAAVPTTETVETSAVTTYTRTKSANAKALAVGLCVTALGKASDTGSIAATSIILRPAENGSCSSGFGRRGPGGSPTSTGGGSGA